MNKNEIIDQLENLRTHCKDFMGPDSDEIWQQDVEALDYAINLVNDCRCSLLHRFNEGDKVKIKQDLVVGEYYDGLLFSARMESYRGKELTIAVSSSGEYLLHNLPYLFNDEMLEPAE